MVFINTVAPVFFIVALGYIAGRLLKIDPKPTSRVALYVFTPALVFNSLSTAKMLPSEVLTIAGSAVAIISVMAVIALVCARALKLPPLTTSAVILGTSMMNAGNYGLPINLFAFGQPGFDRAMIFMVTMSIAVNTLGVFVVARGRGATKDAFKSVLRMPAIYAAIAGIAVQLSGWTLPEAIAKPVSMLSTASVPLFLIVLGTQLVNVKFKPELFKAASLITGLRMLVSPLLALGLTSVLGIHGLPQKVIILEAGMPLAVNTVILAGEYDAEPELISTAILVTTVLSLLTLTVIISLLGRM